ncbi:uncharacterized protein DS421_7g213640 [Arachis hypogaea]|nr:uncharacterized protein DS421_7g213640 [Arachis hypogaea]
MVCILLLKCIVMLFDTFIYFEYYLTCNVVISFRQKSIQYLVLKRALLVIARIFMHVYPFGRRPITFSSAITIIYYDSTCHKWEEKQRIQSSRSPTLTFLVMHGNCLQKAKAMKIVCNAIRDTSNLLQMLL